MNKITKWWHCECRAGRAWAAAHPNKNNSLWVFTGYAAGAMPFLACPPAWWIFTVAFGLTLWRWQLAINKFKPIIP